MTAQNKGNRKMTYDLLCKDHMEIGQKKIALIPTELLFADERYQRTESLSSRKISRLARNFDPQQMDMLKVSARNDLCAFSVVDGFHRLEAAKKIGIEYLECEMFFDLSLEEEAKLFSKQNDYVDKLTPGQTHKAKVLLGVEECIELEDACRRFSIEMKDCTKRGKAPEGTIQSYTDALAIAKRNGKRGLIWVFSTLKDCSYTAEQNGLSSYTLYPIAKAYEVFGCTQDVKDIIVDYLKQFSPSRFRSICIAEFPMRSPRLAASLHLNNILKARLSNVAENPTNMSMTS